MIYCVACTKSWDEGHLLEEEKLTCITRSCAVHVVHTKARGVCIVKVLCLQSEVHTLTFHAEGNIARYTCVRQGGQCRQMLTLILTTGAV